jgi:HD domain-containing protein
MASWWASKVRQFRSHVRARVAPDERAALAGWVTPDQLALFDSMHVADRRHGLDVVTTLREQGVTDEEVLLAGLLHDAGKGRTGVWPRVAYSLGQAYGAWIWRVAGVLPPMRAALERLREHAETSARLAERAGASPRTVDLIRHQEAPVDPDAGRLLQLADEAN